MTTPQQLVDALAGASATDRQRIAMHLGTTDVTPVITPLVDAMATEPDDFVRETLIWATVSRPEAAAPALVAALGRDDLPREPVLHALSKVGDPSTVAAVLPFADDPDPVVAAKAWWVLGRITTDDSLPVLVAHLGQGQAELRHGLTRALLQVGGPAVDALAGALDSDDAAVRSHAAEVLVALADASRQGTAERRSGDDTAARAAGVLRNATAPEVDGALLLATVTDDRAGLVEAAGRLRDERA